MALSVLAYNLTRAMTFLATAEVVE